MGKASISILTSPITEVFLPSMPAASPIDTPLSPTRDFLEDPSSVDTLMQQEHPKGSTEAAQDFTMEHNTAFDQHMLGGEEDEEGQQRPQEQGIEHAISLDLKREAASGEDDEDQHLAGLQQPRLRLHSPRKKQRRTWRQTRSPRQTTAPLPPQSPLSARLEAEARAVMAETSAPATTAAQTSTTISGSTTKPLPSIAARRRAMKPALQARLRHLSLRLCPLVNVSSGQAHPGFPQTMLAYHLLTDAQLEDMAGYYHQRTPSPWTRLYPCPVDWATAVTTADKRRKFGRFIGLKGCDSPGATETGTPATTMPYVPTMEDIQEAARRAVILAEMEAMRRASKGG